MTLCFVLEHELDEKKFIKVNERRDMFDRLKNILINKIR